MTSITIPNSVTSIGDYAFSNCSFTSITIPNSVTSIGCSAFEECSSLKSIEIPNSVTTIGSSAFRYCSGLTSIIVDSSNKNYDSRENCNAIIETQSNTLIAGCNNSIIPNGVTSIGDDAFNHCTGLTSITIPNSVTSIGDETFFWCTGLTSITIPNSVTSIGKEAFHGCSGLTSIIVDSENKKYDSRNNCNAIIETQSNTLIAGCNNTIIPNDVTSIGNSAFYICTSLTSITIPNSVTSIGSWAFCGCNSLKSITCDTLIPPTLDWGVFEGVTMNCTLRVPEESIDLYRAADQWKDFYNIVASGVDVIEVDDVTTPAIYYNLNGVRVDGELAPGVYIKQQGSKTEKVFVN